MLLNSVRQPFRHIKNNGRRGTMQSLSNHHLPGPDQNLYDIETSANKEFSYQQWQADVVYSNIFPLKSTGGITLCSSIALAFSKVSSQRGAKKERKRKENKRVVLSFILKGFTAQSRQ